MPEKWKSGTSSGRQESVEKRNWFRLCQESGKAEPVPVMPGKYRKAELVSVSRKIERMHCLYFYGDADVLILGTIYNA